jgi:ATP-dependent exoDNAse (exonuclease V) beta subunit
MADAGLVDVGLADTALVDAEARRAIGCELARTIFVEAGAGSGKTSALVDRVVALVTADPPVAMRHIAAITFTEKAAAELRDRIRKALLARAEGDPLAAESCHAALDELDGAAVSTLHAFAQRILREHPIEAGLPPGVEILDEVSSIVDFDERWRQYVDELLDAERLRRSVLLARTAGIRLDDLRDLAEELNANWDLVEERVPLHPAAPPHLEGGRLVERLGRLVVPPDDVPADDTMVRRLEELADYHDQLQSAADEADLLSVLRYEKPSFRVGGCGNKARWGRRADDLLALRADLTAWAADRDALVQQVTEAAVVQLMGDVARFTLDGAAERARTGRLQFHDLLVLARRLLRHPEHGVDARAALAGRYHRLLIDEFQDTDPIQIELAALLASDDPAAGGMPWSTIEPAAGRLFFVGDPKQSIYRFRRADIATFLRARAVFGDPPLHLTQNFRTVEPVIAWVNHVFARLIAAETDRQPEYVPLAASRREPPPVGPPVVVCGLEDHADEPKADELRNREAADIAGVVARALAEGWSVHDDGAGWRPARPGDVTILVPSRISLPSLERALDKAGVAYRVDSSSLVYSTREVRDLLAAARAVDDPTDQLSLVTALRSPGFGCGDDDLYEYRVLQRGAWNHQADPPASLPADHPVVEGMRYLGELHRQRWWVTPSQLLDRIARDRRLFELGVVQGRPRDVWRRLRFVIDQARAYGESVGGSLRAFLAWARLQGDENARVAETILPETDTDTVRIMTIHAAKGLEFPICVLSGSSTARSGRQSRVAVGFPLEGGVELKVGKDFESRRFEEFQETEDIMGHHERLRLLYVAATRARDHLVVSLHHPTSRSEPAADRMSAGALLARACDGAAHELLQPGAVEPLTGDESAPVATPAGPLDHAEWAAALERRLRHGRGVRTVAATTLAAGADRAVTLEPAADQGQLLLPLDAGAGDGDPGLAKQPRDLELPPWNKGRYGTAVGRAVHGVLQAVDLATGEGIAAVAAAQAAAEGVPGRQAVVEALARSALASATVRAAAGSPHWRELYVAAPVGDVLVEGYIDLLYRGPDGLVVVDHKTDQVAGEADTDAKVARYRLQGAAYARALGLVLGEPVARMVFVFCRPDGPAVERTLPDLAAAMAEVDARLPEVAADPRYDIELV